jgi:hypothetical protein
MLLRVVRCMFTRCMWSATCRLLHVVCCMWSVACRLLHVTCCMLSVACCLLHAACGLPHAVCCMLSVACCLLHVVCCMLHAACCLLHVVCRMPSVACRLLHAVCCMPSVACRLLHAACCMLLPGAHALEAGVLASTHARAERASAGAVAGMAVAHEAVGRKASVARALTHCWSRLPYIPCTAAPHPSLQSSAGLQLAQIEVAGTKAEKALLAKVKEEHPEDSYIELLRLFNEKGTPQRRRWALVACMLHRVCCAFPARICSQLPHLNLTWLRVTAPGLHGPPLGGGQGGRRRSGGGGGGGFWR